MTSGRYEDDTAPVEQMLGDGLGMVLSVGVSNKGASCVLERTNTALHIQKLTRQILQGKNHMEEAWLVWFSG